MINLSYDQIKPVLGINLATFSLLALTQITYLVIKVALPILFNPKTNMTAIKLLPLAIIGFGYLAYKIVIFSKIVIIKSLGVLLGSNQYIGMSFHGYKFEWLQLDKGYS